MFQDLKKHDIVTVIVLVFFVSVIGYYYANSQARNLLWLKTYPLRAELSVRQMSCSNNSPAWMTEVLEYQTRNNNAPSNQIAYIDRQGTLHHCENGYIGQYPILSDAVTEQTRFRYASVTKLWTSDAILSLIKEDRLTLDTKLTDIITEIDNPTDERINDITIGQLLLHRAGFNRYTIYGNDMFGIGKAICPNNLERLNDIKLGFDPESKTSYSNLGYCLLGAVISRINNQPYKEVIAEQYDFADSQLQFVSNAALPDEVFYNYVETGLTGYPDIYTAFDYDALASAAGLSGNATQLAQQVKSMVSKSPPNIISQNENVGCDIHRITEECYGYAMLAYQPKPQLATVYYRDGSLLGLSTLVAIDGRGGVVTLLSNGTPDTKVDHNIKKKIYGYLTTGS